MIWAVARDRRRELEAKAFKNKAINFWSRVFRSGGRKPGRGRSELDRLVFMARAKAELAVLFGKTEEGHVDEQKKVLIEGPQMAPPAPPLRRMCQECLEHEHGKLQA